MLICSSDGWLFSINDAIARDSTFLDHLISTDKEENDFSAKALQLNLIDGEILAQVVSYLEKRQRGFEGYISQEVWEAAFLAGNHGRLADLLIAADFLDIQALFKLICRGICNVIKQENTPKDENRKAVLLGKILSLSPNISIVDIWAKGEPGRKNDGRQDLEFQVRCRQIRLPDESQSDQNY